MRAVLFALVSFVTFVVHSAARAEFPRFIAHDINPGSEYPACAVLDVNHDGKMDIVSGGFWYEGPTWTKHFLREVEVIRGRFDDYSNLEVDVNADGWIDIVSVNYRSQSLFWMENPGEKLKANPDTPWIKHMIDTPGPMETGRLYDVDGDGQLDILPNGTTFAAWYSLESREKWARGADGKLEPKYLRHDLPMEVAGHGVGFGDINGDGRGDVIGPKGWLEAPEDRRGGRWQWHAEWELTRDASVPVIVHDVDGDGDNDLVWGRGHRYGLYWLEQGREGEKRVWMRHAIDTSWAQPHSIYLADLDGDKRVELVAGKRYMGHEGKDPGEYDLLCAYAYRFVPATRAWQRHEIYFNHRAGFGLDPKAADIDGDGDLDLVAADRSSLVWFENVPASAASPGKNDRALAAYDHRQPLLVADGGAMRGAKNAAGFAARRHSIQRGMEEVMGTLPDSSRRVPLEVRVQSREETPEYVRIKLDYAAEGGGAEAVDRVPAYLLVPKSVTLAEGGIGGASTKKNKEGQVKRLPAMLCLHPTNADGKAQTAGLVGAATRHYGHELAKQGYVCLIPDYPSFGDYKGYDFHRQTGYEYRSGSMKAIWNNIRGIDLLETLGYVDADNIGAIGHSLGGHNALFTAVFEPRLKAVVTSCGFTAFHDYYKGDLKGWTSDRYMPLIRDQFGSSPDKMPFDFHEVLAAIAPRGVYVAAPVGDGNFEVGGVKACVAAAQPVFAALGAKDQLVAEHPECGHDFPDEVRGRVYAWLEKQLK